MPKKTQSYDAWQLENLADPVLAASFLNASLQDSSEMFLVALRKVAQAKQMAKVAKEAKIQRETLYQSLSAAGNPTLQTLSSILNALGLQISICESSKASGVSRTKVGVSALRNQSLKGRATQTTIAQHAQRKA